MRLAELHDQKLANKLFDMAVNMGVHQATIYAQRAVNGLIIAAQALNTSGAAEMPEQPELVAEDGVIGPRTLTALNAADPAKLYAALVRVVAPALRTRRGHQSGASKESVGMAEEGRSVEQLAISN
jgi:lysozyme family protein